MVFFERTHNLGVHISKLTAVALVKDYDHALIKHLMSLVLTDKHIKFLYRCNDNAAIAFL